MTRGYLVLAQNSTDVDYLRMAYALALSIKNSQTVINNISLVTDIDINTIDPKIKSVFDKILPIPWGNNASNSNWKIENKWKYYYITPYTETVILDADMIFPTDVSYWWDILSTQDVYITDKPQTFKGEIITSTMYRAAFVDNNLPNVYTAFMYFKKSILASELFKMVDLIFQNWTTFYKEYLTESRPTVLSGDVAYALAIKILGIEDKCFGNLLSVPSFVHMKSYLQNIDQKYITNNWPEHIPTYFKEDGSFKIANYEQVLPFHYHIKKWLTDKKISILEKNVGIK